jgi:hypothetical protein
VFWEGLPRRSSRLILGFWFLALICTTETVKMELFENFTFETMKDAKKKKFYSTRSLSKSIFLTGKKRNSAIASVEKKLL